MSGPLGGLRVVELVGQGPGPYCGMLLADMGADVVAVDRPAVAAAAPVGIPATNPMMRGKRGVALDLKSPDDRSLLLALVAGADVLIDPFRPGVCERLGIGPEVLCEQNPRLIYGRMTGWGQSGPLAHTAGHDIDYIALSGALHMIGYGGDESKPVMPINLLGDFAGGGLLLAFGIASAAFERSLSGRGQVIDAAMVDGAAMILGPFFVASARGTWGPRGTNHLDGAAPFYNVYRTADGRWVAVGAIEPQFHAELYARLGIAEAAQWDRAQWPDEQQRLEAVFATRSMAEWCDVFDGGDACFAPVLTPSEVATHPHTAARGTAVEIGSVLQAQAAPRFSRTPGGARVPVHPGSSAVADVLEGWNL